MREVLATGCQAVPKSDPSGDKSSWRLSFSRGELLLSQHVPHKARLAYVALKVFYKDNLKSICPSIRSYHIKTIFYHFLEKHQWKKYENSSIDSLVMELLKYLQLHLKLRSCPHFFIPSLNLLSFTAGPHADRIIKEMDLCSKHIQESMKDTNILVNLFSTKSWNIILIKHLRNENPIILGCFIIVTLMLNVFAIFGGAFVYVLGFFSVLSLFINFLYGSLISVPILCVIFIVFKLIKRWKQ